MNEARILKERLESIWDEAYGEGYRKGVSDGKRKALSFLHEVLKECYPNLSWSDIFKLVQNALELYGLRRLKAELEEQVGRR